MNRIKFNLTASVVLGAVIVFAAPVVLADDCPKNVPPFSNVVVPGTSQQTGLVVYQGYSTQGQRSPDGQGTSSIAQITSTSDGSYQVNPGNPANHFCEVGGDTVVTYEYEGPGGSPAEQLLADRTDDEF